MHSGLIKNSERHQRIIRVFMAADHPLSGEEISARVQSEIGRIPQAVSTTIGEMRSSDNIADGYVVSFACIWRVCKGNEQPGPRPKRDGGSLFLMHPSQALPWHDGRPRYWLQAAPGWVPRWWINDQGVLVQSAGNSVQSADRPSPQPRSTGSGQASPRQGEDERRCMNPACRKPIQRTPEDPLKITCDDSCKSAWKESIFKKPEGALL